MDTAAELPIVHLETQSQWREWLHEYGAHTKGVWLAFAKKSSPYTSISYDQAVEEALCFGWIDAQVRAKDQDFWLQKFTPRGPRSTWSKINVEKVEALMKAGRIETAGMAAIEKAKASGAWAAAYDPPSTMTVPEDFQSALDAHPAAKDFFKTLNKTNTYAFCWRLQTAKKPETRQARIDKFISMLERGEKLY